MHDSKVRGTVMRGHRLTHGALPQEPGAEETRPPDLRTAKWRTEANVAANRLVAAKDPSDMTPDDHAVLERYSGWGGLSIERVKSTLPPDLVPETFGLIHEYFTPSAGQAEQGE